MVRGPAHDRADGAVAPGLLRPAIRADDAQLSYGRNFAHGLDFNSLRGYNERNDGPSNRSCRGSASNWCVGW